MINNLANPQQKDFISKIYFDIYSQATHCKGDSSLFVIKTLQMQSHHLKISTNTQQSDLL